MNYFHFKIIAIALTLTIEFCADLNDNTIVALVIVFNQKFLQKFTVGFKKNIENSEDH